MPAADLPMAASFLEEHRNELTAALTIVGAFVLAEIVDRAMLKRGHRIGEAVAGRELSPVADTRLRLVRRLVFATIIVIGIALALATRLVEDERAEGVKIIPLCPYVNAERRKHPDWNDVFEG